MTAPIKLQQEIIHLDLNSQIVLAAIFPTFDTNDVTFTPEAPRHTVFLVAISMRRLCGVRTPCCQYSDLLYKPVMLMDRELATNVD